MIRRLSIGMLKGIVLGGALGALMQFGPLTFLNSGGLRYVAYGLLGVLTGVLAGRAPWKPGAWIESVLKGLFGLGVGCGLFALASHFMGGIHVPALAGLPGGALPSVPVVLAPLLAMVYSSLVELDNTDEPNAAAGSQGVRVDADKLLASIPDDDEAAAPKQQPASRKR